MLQPSQELFPKGTPCRGDIRGETGPVGGQRLTRMVQMGSLILRRPVQYLFKGEGRKLVTSPNVELVLELHPVVGRQREKRGITSTGCTLTGASRRRTLGR